MSIHRSSRYEAIHDEQWNQYATPPSDVRDASWWRQYAPKWRNRVGLPRLVADAAAGEAAGLLRSINPGLFRSDPDMLALLRAAQDAVSAFSTAMGQESWRRFQGDERSVHVDGAQANHPEGMTT